MAASWMMTGVGIVDKIRNATRLISLRLGQLVSQPHVKCPNCKFDIDTSDVTLVWPALPAGVKFDPTDLELLEHLQEKSSLPNLKPYALIDEFIPTIKEMEGICYTHPKNLPGIKMDGSTLHFFHKVSNAYGCGHRKRRKVYDGSDISNEQIRWHKTGKSKVICDEKGVKKGWKKILVLYKGTKRGGADVDRDNWVMHQYHLGLDEDEAHGEFVVSKVFYQLSSRKNDKYKTCNVVADSDAKINPPTPKTNPQPHHPTNNSSLSDPPTPVQVDQGEENCGTSIYRAMDGGVGSPAGFDGPQAVTDTGLPALVEPMQIENNPDAALETVYEELPELNLQCLGAPSTSLADVPLGSPDNWWGHWPWTMVDRR